MNPTLEDNLFVKPDCERVKINLRSTTLSSPSVTYICHRGGCVKGEVCDIVGCDVPTVWCNRYRYRRFGSIP